MEITLIKLLLQSHFFDKDFVPMINMSMTSIMESNINAVNVTKDQDRCPKLGPTSKRSLYFEEILAKLIEKVQSKNRNNSRMKSVTLNLKQSKITDCAMILAGVKYKIVPEHIAITNAYLSTRSDSYIKEKILAIDLGYNALKLYNINIDGKQVNYELETYNDWSSHELTLALYNYVMDLSETAEHAGLMEECETAKAALSIENSYTFKVGGSSILREDFESCIYPVVQKLCYKLKEFLKYDLSWDSNIMFIGASFNIPLVFQTIKGLFDSAIIVDVGVESEYVISYGSAVYLKKCNKMRIQSSNSNNYSNILLSQ